ncbi:MAG: site-2 protease family protein [Microthrixaceae bacterium]
MSMPQFPHGRGAGHRPANVSGGTVWDHVRPGPVFLGTLAGFVASGVWLWMASARWLVFVFVTLGWVVSLCLHEFGHALVAYLGGDTAVADKGYLTLDPRLYAHPVLSLALPLLFLVMGGIGLPGGAVGISTAALRSRRWESAVSLAGPAANLIIAVLCLAPFGLGLVDQGPVASLSELNFAAALAFLGFLQVTALVLNLLPIPGLDGFGAIAPHLSSELRRTLDPMRQFGILLAVAVLWLPGPNRVFFGFVRGLTEAAGADRFLSSFGYALYRFWETIPI